MQGQGLRSKVAEGLIIDADAELVDDDLAHPQSIRKAWCSFQAPGNWRLDAIDSALSDEDFFSIEASGGALVTFSNFGTELGDLDELLEETVTSLRSEVTHMVLGEKLTRWGKLHGLGQHVIGTPKSHPVELHYTLFVFQHPGGAATVSQGCLGECLNKHRLAFELIANSFACPASE